MSESIQHQKLVRFLTVEIKKMIQSDCWSLIQIDSPESSELPPQTDDGYRPDVYYRFESLLIIGEAKTKNDIEKHRSRAQYESYLKECSIFSGQAFMVLAVPLLEKTSASNILKRMKKEIPGDYEIVVTGWIEDLT